MLEFVDIKKIWWIVKHGWDRSEWEKDIQEDELAGNRRWIILGDG